MNAIRQIVGWLLLLGVAFTLCGCATQRIDWSARVGIYTYDQAITDMGPPERSAKLSDGSTVAEWLKSRGIRSGYVTGGFGYFGPDYGPYGFYGGPVFVTESPSHDTYLRLTFDKDGKLALWKYVAR